MARKQMAKIDIRSGLAEKSVDRAIKVVSATGPSISHTIVTTERERVWPSG
jgi:hypothetical protein